MNDDHHKLKENTIGFWGLVAIGLAGILPIFGPIEVSAFINDAGPASMWPVILGAILFLIISLPIIEYTRIVPFAGGYYGLAELGFGKAAGKFTGLLNMIYGFFWLASNAFAMGWIITDTIYYVLGYLIPIWVWMVVGIMVLIAEYFVATLNSNLLSKIIFYTILLGMLVVLIFSIYVTIRSPYNSLYYLNPLNSPTGFSGVALATATVGFYTYVGYGTSLFFSEEAKDSRTSVYKAIYVSVIISTIVIAFIAYSETVAVPLSQLSTVGSSSLPQIVSWSKYLPLFSLLILNMFIFIASTIAMSADIGYTGRLMWSLATDNFIKNNWIKKLDPKQKTPKNATMLYVIFSSIIFLVIGLVLTTIYGYNASTVAVTWYTDATIGTIIWYFHHFIPEVGLFNFIRKHKEISYSKIRLWIVGLIIPVIGIVFFAYTFYEGIIGDLAEPYFGALILATAVIIGSLGYIVYKWRKNDLGESWVLKNVSESNKQ
ncbi:APC family permease [Sulfolobus sp. F1]|nr:APC family permease [Sulfolobus sp. F1]